MDGYDKLGRPHKDIVFMEMCFAISKRSIDKSSKHGCLIVSEDGSILTGGYNNPIRNADDKNVPIDVYPDKYYYMQHSEVNAIYNAARNGIKIEKGIVYITGFPCTNCLSALIQTGCSKIIYGPVSCKNMTSIDVYENILKNQKIIIERFKYAEALFKENPYIEKIIRERIIKGYMDIIFEYNKIYCL